MLVQHRQVGVGWIWPVGWDLPTPSGGHHTDSILLSISGAIQSFRRLPR